MAEEKKAPAKKAVKAEAPVVEEAPKAAKKPAKKADRKSVV